MKTKDKAVDILAENETLRQQLAEAQETLRAIQHGEVDALVVSTPEGEQVYSITGAEKPYRVLIEEMKEGAVMLSEDDTIFYCNKGFAKIVKQSLDALIGKSIVGMVNPTHLNSFHELLSLGRKSKIAEEKDIAFLASDGIILPAHVSVNSLLTDNLKTTFLVITDLTEHMQQEVKQYTTDLELEITQRKKAEEALRQSEARLQLIAHAGRIGFFEYNTSKDTAYWSPEHYEILGYEQDAVISWERWLQGIHSEDRLRVLENSARLMERGRSEGHVQGHKDEYRFIRPDGAVVWIESDVSLSMVNNEAIIRGSIRDITERKKTEEALKESEAKLNAAFASMNEAVFIADTEGRLIDFNDEFVRYHRFRDREECSRTVADCPKYLEAFFADGTPAPPESWAMPRALRSETASNFEYMLIRKDTGETWWGSYNFGPVKDKFGRVIGGIVACREITERKKAEEALKKALQQTDFERKRLETILEMSPSAIVIIEAPDGRFSLVNKHAQELYGIDFRGVDLATNVAKVKASRPDGTAYEVDDVPASRALRLGEVRNEEMIIYNADGKAIPVFVSAGPVRDAQGNITAAIVIFEDISEAKKTEEELKRSEENALQSAEELRKLMDIIPAAVWISRDPECRVIVGNQAANTFYEAKAEENVSAGSANGSSRDTTRRFFRNGKELKPQELPMQEAVAKNIEIINSELEVVAPSGRKIMILGNAKPLLNNAGKVRGCLAAFVDITELKKAQEALEEYKNNLEKLIEERTKQLKDSERLAAIGATAGMVGHDIRNPLQAIVSDLYIARQEIAEMHENEGKKNMLETLSAIEENVFYINKIIADLQDFARPLNPQTKETSIKTVIEKALETNGGVPDKVKTQIKVDADAEFIVADEDFLRRIVGNLILNALQAMPDGGELTFIAFKNKQTNDIVLTVKDTGIGIPDEIKPKIFTPMMTTKAKGQGFGLAVVKRMTEALGGRGRF